MESTWRKSSVANANTTELSFEIHHGGPLPRVIRDPEMDLNLRAAGLHQLQVASLYSSSACFLLLV
jgi:hypothetical protein